ncbi:MAG: FecR family protein [Spirochaetaceae bacterium]|jgi:hypothetical protein|nr:FecR family protein [Spirochaetaceae bacterium]
MKKKNRIADIIVVLICFSGALFSGLLFWRDLTRTLTKNSEIPVGIISYKRNGAQRRFGERLAWASVQRESPVYNGDLIRTADLSDAVITFDNATEVSLSENSLIQAFYDPDMGARLELSGGNISVDSRDKGLVISSGGKELTLSAGSTVSVDAGEEFAVRVMAGSVSLHSSGESRELAAGDALSVDASGYIEEKPQVTVLAPLPGQTLLGSGPASVAFSFQSSNFSEEERVRLDIASDRRFSRLIKTVDSPSNSGMTVELAPGAYWWRAYPRSGDAAFAASGRLSIVNASSPIPRYPGRGALFSYRDRPPEIQFRWTDGGSPSGDDEAVYTLEAADNPDMLNPRLSEKVGGYFYTTGNLGEGTWYWRVTPRYPESYGGTVPRSAVSAFTIEHAPETAAEVPPPEEPPEAEELPPVAEIPPVVEIPPVRIRPEPPPEPPPASRVLPVPLLERPGALEPSPDAVIDAAYIRRNAGAAPFTSFFTFSWKPVPGANAYSFELYRSGSGEGDAASGAVPLVSVPPSPQTSYRLENLAILENGGYIWRISALSIAPDGTVERRGETAEYRFTLSIPRPGAPALTVPDILYGL